MGRGLRKYSAEETLELDLDNILDRGHIKPRQVIQDGQRSSERGLRTLGILETLSGSL